MQNLQSKNIINISLRLYSTCQSRLQEAKEYLERVYLYFFIFSLIIIVIIFLSAV